MNKFEVNTVDLQGANLVEASAGTGKTYSIAILVLRLIVEKNIPIKEILMVTFTNLAVAELAERVRKFIRLAIKAAEGGNIDEEPIKAVLLKYGNNPEALTRLRKALMELDEASIQTIHSFCQESLNSYALDSGQPFGLELETDVLEIAAPFVRDFWRKEITVLGEIPYSLVQPYISIETLSGAVRNSLMGSKYCYEAAFSEDELEVLCNAFSEFEKQFQIDRAALERKVLEVKNGHFREGARKIFIEENLSEPKNFYAFLTANSWNAAYKKNLATVTFAEEQKKALNIKERAQVYIHSLFCSCIQETEKKIKTYLQERHKLTYDEIISRMHQAVLSKQEFKEAIHRKYQAVFIDEFQDTDKRQFEIYDCLFGEGKILFYIGDPKQSIYGWRQADLNTYFKAAEGIPEQRCFQMKTNFRSSDAYVEEMNNFFSRVNDPFHTGTEEGKTIPYIKVSANSQDPKGLCLESSQLKPLQVFRESNNNNIKKKCLCLVQEVLNGKYQLNHGTGKKAEQVKPSDIGILVRKNREAQEIRNLLAEAGIRAVTVEDTKVFEDSEEARDLSFILEAVLSPTQGTINKALLNNLTPYTSHQIKNLEYDDLLELFRGYRETWKNSGVYAMLRQFMMHFEVMGHLMNKPGGTGLRTLSNLLQILEILQEVEFKQELKPAGVYSYLIKKLAGDVSIEDEYEQRIESDENAVKIITIHKAKGLEYPVVIAPFLDLNADELGDFSAFRETAGDYKFYHNKLREEEHSSVYRLQQEQENRRLLYVAVTRAKFNCFIFKSTANFFNNSCLSHFVINEDMPRCLDLPEEQVKMEIASETNPVENWRNASEIMELKLSDYGKGKVSFSGLSTHGAYIVKDNSQEPEDAYEKFLFKDLPRGTVPGDMLHLIFERIDFTDETTIEPVVQRLVESFYSHKKETFVAPLIRMVKEVLNARIETADKEIVQLCHITASQKCSEFEFDYSASKVNLQEIAKMPLDEGVEVNTVSYTPVNRGLLTGFIDLFFESNGKYYILDWKSNFLGSSNEDYEQGKLTEAMNEGNYHLQYLLYTMTLKKYLEARLGSGFDFDSHFGGIIYVFLRGIRKDSQNGFFTARPNLEQIQALEKAFGCIVDSGMPV